MGKSIEQASTEPWGSEMSPYIEVPKSRMLCQNKNVEYLKRRKSAYVQYGKRKGPNGPEVPTGKRVNHRIDALDEHIFNGVNQCATPRGSVDGEGCHIRRDNVLFSAIHQQPC